MSTEEMRIRILELQDEIEADLHEIDDLRVEIALRECEAELAQEVSA